MFLKVKRIQQLDELVLEANLITAGNQLTNISNKLAKIHNNSDNKESQNNTIYDIWQEMDAFIDSLINKGIIDLDKELNKPIYEKEFGAARGQWIAKEYLKYCKEQLYKITVKLAEEVSNNADKETIDKLGMDRVQIAARIETLERIYKAFKQIEHDELNKGADAIIEQIDDIKNIFAQQQTDIIKKIGQTIQHELTIVKSQSSDQEETYESAKNIITQLQSLEKVMPFFTEEAKSSAQHASSIIEEELRSSIGNTKFEEIKRMSLANDEETKVLSRILELKHMNFTNEDQIHSEVRDIKISINGLKAGRKDSAPSTSSVISYLEETLQKEYDALIEKARNKSITLKDAKGIHYSFNTQLKLHQIVDLPVTGKQIADSNIIMRFRKMMNNIISLMPAAESPLTAAGQAWSNLGKQTHKLYAVALNNAGKFIGRMIKGREGELMGDAITRLLIPNTSVVDKKPVMEEGGAAAPGLAMQVPGSIGNAGPIEAPTRTTIGSGDKFSSNSTGTGKQVKKKKKSKKKKYNVYEEKMSIMNFSDFSKNKNA